MAAATTCPLTLLKACAHRGNIADAENLFERMAEKGQELSVEVYNFMIHTCTQVGDLTRAEYYLKMMDMCGFKPTLISFNMMINACAAAGEEARAEKWLDWMISRGITPTEVTYGSVCKAYARKGSVGDVQRMMSKCEASGMALNEYFYASLISACGVCEPPDRVRAEQAFGQLMQRGLRVQRVKRALGRVVGNMRASELIDAATGEGLHEGAPWNMRRKRIGKNPNSHGKGSAAHYEPSESNLQGNSQQSFTFKPLMASQISQQQAAPRKYADQDYMAEAPALPTLLLSTNPMHQAPSKTTHASFKCLEMGRQRHSQAASKDGKETILSHPPGLVAHKSITPPPGLEQITPLPTPQQDASSFRAVERKSGHQGYEPGHLLLSFSRI